MDIYQAAVKQFEEIVDGSPWTELITGFERMADKEPRGWALPTTACQAVSGDIRASIPAVVAIGCMQMSIILIDDMLDEDPRGKHNKIGMAAAANLASAYQAAGLLACSFGNASDEVKLQVHSVVNNMMLGTAYGQSLDIQNPNNEQDYWHLVKTKSSPYYSNSLFIGALYGNAPTDTTMKIKEIGALYGEIIQIHDDLGDTMATPAGPDWIQGRFPLPILFTHVVDHPEREQFIHLLDNIDEGEALEEAQEILIRCGAISYCLDQLVQRYETMQKMISELSLFDHNGFNYLLFEVIHPIKELAHAIGVELPVEIIEASKESLELVQG